MLRILLRAFLLVFIVFPGPASGAERELLWCRLDAPPLYIAEEPLLDTGYVDRFQKELFPLLGGYRHKVAICNIARALEMIRQTPNSCNAVLVHTKDREKFVHYSRPIIGLMPNRVIVLSDNSALLTPYLTDEGVDLGRLLRESNLSVGLLQSRAYGGYIDKHLKHAKDSRFVQWFQQSTLGVLQLLAGRIDVLIAYVNEVVYMKRARDLPQEISSYPVIGEQFVDVYVGCSDTPLGREVVSEVDRLLDQGLRGAYLEYYLEWVDQGSHDAVREHVADRPGVE